MVFVAATSLAALAGMVLLWPRGDAPDLGDRPTRYVDAEIVGVEDTLCDAGETDALIDCRQFDGLLRAGPDAGGLARFVVRETDLAVPDLERGDDVVLLDVPTSPEPYRYVFIDVQRGRQLWVLVGLFAVVVVGFGRVQGVRALVGLLIGGAVLVAFVVPSVLRDNNAVAVAAAGTVLIAVAALYLAHGVNMATTVALTGTLASLALTTALAMGAVTITRLSGLSDESAQLVRVTAGALDLRGLLVAGIVIGALGVLDDVTVTQVSAVAALRSVRPDMGRGELYEAAVRVGRDHVASTVNTLILAYAGAALPLLVAYEQGLLPAGRFVASEQVATELVRMLVGSIGVVAAVPITTLLAAFVVLPSDSHGGHSHGGHSHGGQSHGGHSHGDQSHGGERGDGSPRYRGDPE